MKQWPDYEALARGIPSGVVLFDEFGVVYANDEAARLLAAPGPEALLGLQAIQFYAEIDADDLITRREALEAQGPGAVSTRT